MEPSKHTILNEQKWDQWAKTLDKDSRRNNYLRKAQSEVVSLLELKGDFTVLDLGCGTGWALRRINDLYGGNGELYGVDLSEKMIEKAKENFKSYDNFHFVKGNAEAIPLESKMFDAVICTNSFHHYLHPDKALKEIHRVLKDGGKEYILDPTADRSFIKFADSIIRVLEPSHVKIYSSKEFENMMRNAGLQYKGSKAINNHEKIHIGQK